MKKATFFWIIGGGLMQVPLLAEAQKLGLKVIVSDQNPNCICRKDADLFFPLDIFDVQSHLEKAGELRREGVGIKGVLAAGIDATVTMAEMAKKLNLPGVDPELASLTNHKPLFREKMKSLNFPTPDFVKIDELSQVETAIEKIKFPFIVKNTDSSGSRGTKIFRESTSLEEVIDTVELAQKVSRSGQALMESLWEGEEYTVETLFDVNGNFHRCFITDRIFDLSRGYALETGLHHPTRLEIEKQNELYLLVENLARSLGVKIGAAKADIMYTKDGPRIIEFTVRLSGGFDCQYLVPAATGKNVLRAAILTALGETFDSSLLIDKKKKIGMTGSIWPTPGRIKDISGVEEALEIRGVEQIFFRYKVGDIIEPYVDCTKRVCFIIVTGETEEEAQATFDLAVKKIKIEVE